VSARKKSLVSPQANSEFSVFSAVKSLTAEPAEIAEPVAEILVEHKHVILEYKAGQSNAGAECAEKCELGAALTGTSPSP
jgi:hypothetical protein